MCRNDDLNGMVHSFVKVYSKLDSDVWHVKSFLTCRETSDNLFFLGGVNDFNTRPRVLWVVLIKEVRRCFICQCYGRVQANCSVKKPRCGKCSGSHSHSNEQMHVC